MPGRVYRELTEVRLKSFFFSPSEDHYIDLTGA